MYGVVEDACCRSTALEGGVRNHREGGHHDSEPERPHRGAIGDEDSQTTTITWLRTNGEDKKRRGFHAGSFPTDRLHVQLSTS